MLIYMLWIEKDFVQTYERMGVRTDEISTETIIFDRGVREYVRVNDYDLGRVFALLNITIIDHLILSGSCE